jgi:hypothetical protein
VGLLEVGRVYREPGAGERPMRHGCLLLRKP